jgi:hypothetical protein
MLAARVLSDHFDSVTLLERDRFPETPVARKGLPQGRHAHGLLERGRRALERFLPGLTGELVRAGAEPLDFTRDIAWMSPCGWYVRFPGDFLLLGCTRDLIDWGVRRRVAALPNVRIHQGANVAGLILGPGGARVAGARLRSRTADDEVDYCGAELAADLVVVADGRTSRLPAWLAALGYEPPEETVINSFQGYASRLYRAPAEFAADWKGLYIQQAPPDDPRGGIITPVEGGRWLVSLVGGDGDYPPTDEARTQERPVLPQPGKVSPGHGPARRGAPAFRGGPGHPPQGTAPPPPRPRIQPRQPGRAAPRHRPARRGTQAP